MALAEPTGMSKPVENQPAAAVTANVPAAEGRSLFDSKKDV
jgi:hypothetical protein